MKTSRPEALATIVGIVAALIGVVLVSQAPADLRPFAIVLFVVIYFLAYVVRGYLRAGGDGDRSSR